MVSDYEICGLVYGYADVSNESMLLYSENIENWLDDVRSFTDTQVGVDKVLMEEY